MLSLLDSKNKWLKVKYFIYWYIQDKNILVWGWNLSIDFVPVYWYWICVMQKLNVFFPPSSHLTLFDLLVTLTADLHVISCGCSSTFYHQMGLGSQLTPHPADSTLKHDKHPSHVILMVLEPKTVTMSSYDTLITLTSYIYGFHPWDVYTNMRRKQNEWDDMRSGFCASNWKEKVTIGKCSWPQEGHLPVSAERGVSC